MWDWSWSGIVKVQFLFVYQRFVIYGFGLLSLLLWINLFHALRNDIDYLFPELFSSNAIGIPFWIQQVQVFPVRCVLLFLSLMIVRCKWAIWATLSYYVWQFGFFFSLRSGNVWIQCIHLWGSYMVWHHGTLIFCILS